MRSRPTRSSWRSRSGRHHEVAKALSSWKGKTVMDAMNAFPVPEELDGLRPPPWSAKAFTGAEFVKGFRSPDCGHPDCRSDRRGRPPRHVSVERRRGREDSRGGLEPNNSGSAPVKLGKLNEGGALVHARRSIWGRLDLPGFVQEGAVNRSTISVIGPQIPMPTMRRGRVFREETKVVRALRRCDVRPVRRFDDLVPGAGTVPFDAASGASLLARGAGSIAGAARCSDWCARPTHPLRCSRIRG